VRPGGLAPEGQHGFATPEAAVQQFVKSLAADDFDGAMQAFQLDDVLARAEATVKALLAGAAGSAAPSNRGALVRLTTINVVAEFAKMTRRFVYGLLLADQAEQATDATDANIDAFIRAVDPGRLRAMQIVRIDPPLLSQMASAEGIALARRQAATLRADESTERIALFQLDGNYYRGGFTLLRYGNAWRISELQSIYGNTSLRTDPVPKTTLEEYKELVK
jgi:hypothetical protein